MLHSNHQSAQDVKIGLIQDEVKIIQNSVNEARHLAKLKKRVQKRLRQQQVAIE